MMGSRPEWQADDYIRDIAVPQVKELFTNYGEISILVGYAN